MSAWEAVIGLEIHVHLKTKTKMFCRCELEYGAPENTRTCPVCLGHPGVLPVPNAKAIEWTIKLGLALGCEVAERSLFHRKNYFYPDLPKGYQISQYDEPLCVGGRVTLPMQDGDLEVGVARAHLEEDAAKSVHVGGEGGRMVGADRTLVDYNRGGTPLVEIVTEPDLRSAEQTRRFLQLLRQTIVELDISDAEMEKGSLRCDANVSVRPAGSDELRKRWELKNMNSFRFVGRGIDAAVREQVRFYQDGEALAQETYDYRPETDRLTPHRTKEEPDDYRYFPEPDLVPLAPSRELMERIRAEIPELPAARLRRLEREYALSFEQADVLNGTPELTWLFERVVGDGVEAKTAANVLINEFKADAATVDAGQVALLIEASERIPREAFREALARSGDPGFSAERYLAEAAITDTSELEPLVERVLADNEGQVAAYRAGKEGLLGYFVGQVMRETGGKADPRVVNELLREKLKAPV